MHLMLEEIESEPAIIENYKSKEFEGLDDILRSLERSTIAYTIGNGTSYHAALYSSILLNRKGRNCLPVISSETENWLNTNKPKSSSIVFSQSGNSVDALNAAEELKRMGSMIIGVTNNRNSKLGKIANLMLYTDVGSEQSVVATKSHLAQLMVALKISIHENNGEFQKILEEAKRNAEAIIGRKSAIQELADSTTANTVFLGSGLLYPIALESSLKLMEASNSISYAFSVRDFLHGPRQLLDRNWSVFMLSTDRKIFQELDPYAKRVVDLNEFLEEEFGVNSESEVVRSIQLLLFGQLMSYYTSLSRNLNPDRPSKLTKVVE